MSPTPEFPNWPGNVPPKSVIVVTPELAPKPKPEPEAPVIVALHATIQEAKKAGVVVGDVTAAPLAPQKGPIDAPPESMVVVVVKKFWDSPTIKAARNVMATAVIAVLGVFATACMKVWGAGHSIFEAGQIDWRATEVSAEVAAGLIIGAAILAWKKVKDNNPIQQG